MVTAAAVTALPESKLRAVAAAYLADHPDQDGDAPGKRDRNDASRAWLATQGATVPFGHLAGGIVTDGWMIGATSADAMATGGKADTGIWQPGDGVAARDHLEAIGAGAALGAILDSGTTATADDMSGAYTNAIGRILAGADGDVTAGDLADALAEAVADPEMAEGIVLTQVTTYAGQAAMDVYMASGTGYGRWVNAGDAKVCPACLANSAAGQVRIGQPYPSGDTSPPAHPGGCRCAVVPDWA